MSFKEDDLPGTKAAPFTITPVVSPAFSVSQEDLLAYTVPITQVIANNTVRFANLMANTVSTNGAFIPAFVIDTGARLLAGTVADGCKHPVLRPGDLFLFTRDHLGALPFGHVVHVHTSSITHIIDERGMHKVGGGTDVAGVNALAGVGIVSRYEALKALDLDGKA